VINTLAYFPNLHVTGKKYCNIVPWSHCALNKGAIVYCSQNFAISLIRDCIHLNSWYDLTLNLKAKPVACTIRLLGS
jgi:hypothetical protein